MIQYPYNYCRGVRIFVQDKFYKYDILEPTEFFGEKRMATQKDIIKRHLQAFSDIKAWTIDYVNEEIINQGLTKIVYLGSKSDIPSEVNKRAEAYLDTMNEHNLTPILINKNIAHGEEAVLVEHFLNEQKDTEAIFVSGYSLARLLLQQVEAKNIKVPDNLQIIYYDGDCSFEKSSNMTTLQQPIALMAKRCVEALIAQIEKQSNIPMYSEFQCEFIKGKTTK